MEPWEPNAASPRIGSEAPPAPSSPPLIPTIGEEVPARPTVGCGALTDREGGQAVAVTCWCCGMTAVLLFVLWTTVARLLPGSEPVSDAVGIEAASARDMAAGVVPHCAQTSASA